MGKVGLKEFPNGLNILYSKKGHGKKPRPGDTVVVHLFGLFHLDYGALH